MVLRVVVWPLRPRSRCGNKLLLSYWFAVNTSLSPQLSFGAHVKIGEIWYPRSLNLGVNTGGSCWMTLALLNVFKVRKWFGGPSFSWITSFSFSVSGMNKWSCWFLALWTRLEVINYFSFIEKAERHSGKYFVDWWIGCGMRLVSFPTLLCERGLWVGVNMTPVP